MDLKENLKGLTQLSVAKRVDWRLVIALGVFGVVLVTLALMLLGPSALGISLSAP